jgi:hypothetical protein
MSKLNPFGFLKLAKKTFAVITTSLSVLTNTQSKVLPQNAIIDEGKNNLNYESFQKRILKPKLVLKLNPNHPNKMLLASHTSHSSHSSHVSHYSGSGGGYSGGSSDDSGSGSGLLILGVGAAVAYGAYQIGKSRGNKK